MTAPVLILRLFTHLSFVLFPFEVVTRRSCIKSWSGQCHGSVNPLLDLPEDKYLNALFYFLAYLCASESPLP